MLVRVAVHDSQSFHHIGQFLQALDKNWLSIPDLKCQARCLLRAEKGTSSSTPTSISGTFSYSERLRRQPCTCNDSQTPKAGALNWAIFLEFDDGVEWVFRAPCSSYAAAQGVTGRLLASEAATLKYIREHTYIPVPEVFYYRYLP